MEEVDLRVPAIHVLRGPRQAEGEPPTALAETVDRALELAGPSASRLLLLDEVTAAERWQTAVKVLWDEGRIDRDVVVCTGSSAIDLATGTAERLPGRRGPGRDFLVLPQGFPAFAQALGGAIPPGPGLSIAEIVSPDGQAALLDARLHLPTLQRALERYLIFGGLPAAVAEAVGRGAGPSEQVQSVLWDALVKEVQGRGASIPATQALLERMMRSLGSKMSWSKMAREMAVPLGGRRRSGGSGTDSRTLQSYVEFLAINYFALVLYFWKQDSGSGDVAKDKKVYFGDPLLQTIVAERVGLPATATRTSRTPWRWRCIGATSRLNAAPKTWSRPSACTYGERGAAARSTLSAGPATGSTPSRWPTGKR